jgi:hypothetical protein
MQNPPSEVLTQVLCLELIDRCARCKPVNKCCRRPSSQKQQKRVKTEATNLYFTQLRQIERDDAVHYRDRDEQPKSDKQSRMDGSKHQH